MQSAPGTILSPIFSSIFWGLVLAVHLAGMAIWVGGMAYALFVLRPSLGLLEATQRTSVHLQTLKRFFRLVWHVMPLVLVTGWAMEIFREGGVTGADWHINVMQGLGILMAALFAATYFGPFQRARRALRPQPATLERIRSLVSIKLLLGVVIVVVASLGHSF
ncbi:CopD family protein [Lichenicoccus sp.]|uniref:CopD family protein n=1 Tax=Lichenicoccus sp. TaxID=2781899 RepID=UPI003D095CD0